MSDNIFSWLSEGIDLSSLVNLSDFGVMPLAEDDCTSDSCSQHVCSGDSSSSCGSYSSCSSDGVTCDTDGITTNGTVSASVTSSSVTISISGMSSNKNTRYFLFTTYTSSGTQVSVTTKSVSAGTTSLTHTITGLSSGTSYYTTIQYGPDTSYKYSLSNATYTTTVEYADDSAVITYSATPTTITIYVSSITSRSYERTVRCVKGNTRYENTLAAYATSTVFTFTDLEPETSYYFEVGIRAPDNTRTFYAKVAGDGYVSTTAYNHTLSLTTSATANSISATVTLTSGVADYDLDLTFYLDDARPLDADITAGSLSRTRTWKTDITPATGYVIKLVDKMRKNSAGEYLSWTQKRRTKNNFAWSTTPVKGEPFSITAADWNEYTSQLQAKADYYGKSYSPATVSKGDALTATKMNNIAAVVNWLVENNKGDCSTKLAGVSTGDAVTAAKMNAMVTALNE